MPSLRSHLFLLGALVLLALGAAPARADKCTGAKIKAIAKKEKALFGCSAKEATTSGIAPGCETTVSGKFGTAYNKPTGCSPAAPAEMTCETTADSCQSAVRGQLPDGPTPPNKCEATRLNAAGKLASGELGCYAKAAAKGVPVDTVGCIPKAQGKFLTAFNKVSGCTGDGNPTGIQTLVENQCVKNMADLSMSNDVADISCGSCAPIVIGNPIPGTYKVNGTTGEKRCTTNSASNRFGTCNTDTDCGGTSGSCLNLPWVTADGLILPFATGTATTFTVNSAGAFPTCAHNLCIPCGNPNAACAGIPGCQVAGNPNGCITRATQGCCDQPGFIVPTFTVPLLGGLCSRVDQYDCGVGIINTSNPQTGDLNVKKQGDTSDPGADCCYNNQPASMCIGGVNMMDDPAPKPCTAALTGEGGDGAGKIVTTYGDGVQDPNGIQYRLQAPELSTTWMDGGTMTNGCVDGKFDNGEGLVSQLLLKAEPTTAGATGQFTDQNGDSCSYVGAGFTAALPAGPITVPGGASGPARPQPYNGSAGSVAAAVSEVFSGFGSPLHDIGFVAITPNTPIATASPVACSCTPQAACPE